MTSQAASQRVDRIAGQIREVLGQALVRGEINDPRVKQAGLVTITHVRVTGDLREATALFMVHDADDAALEQVRQGLESASGYLRRLIGRELRLKTTPTLAFAIDRVFEQGEKIDALLRTVGAPGRPGSDPSKQ